MSIAAFAKDELTRAGLFDKDADYDGMLGAAVMRLIKTFAEDEHSGGSASLTIDLFSKLARFEPISPLTGADDEWNEVGADLWQNRRCSHVFKDNERTYDIDGRIFREPNGTCFTNVDSRVDVVFPYTPNSEYVDVPARDAA